MAPGERRDRDRDRGRDRDRDRDDRTTASTDLTALQNDLAKTNQRLEKVAKLSVYTARDVGEMKSHLQIVLFVQGLAREVLAGVLRDYVDARDKVQSGVVEKGQGWNVPCGANHTGGGIRGRDGLRERAWKGKGGQKAESPSKARSARLRH